MTHTRLLVSNFKTSFIFYRDVMNLPVKWGDERGPYDSFDAGDHILALFLRQPMALAIEAATPKQMPTEQDCFCLTFAVEDVDGTYGDLMERGMVPLNEPHDRPVWGIRCFHFRDPEGNLIEINKEMEDAKQNPALSRGTRGKSDRDLQSNGKGGMKDEG